MTFRKSLLVACLSVIVTGQLYAGVSKEEAAKLGNELTPTGAEAGANADGSIPAWNSNGIKPPADYVPGSGDYTSPYKDEKPLYTIDGSNWQQYADKLSEGSKGMFEKFAADGYKMVVYPTKRDFVPPAWYMDNSKKNATGTTLVADGLKIDNNYPGTPFPIPKTGSEVLWNHMIRYEVDHEINYDVYYVGSTGKPVLSTRGDVSNIFPMYYTPDQIVSDAWLKLRINYKAPARRAGEILLVHEPGADYTEGKGRRAWQYLSGQRRVRLAPAVSFDTPNPGVAGTSTYDDSFIYNGSPERYDWKLLGKKEILIPGSNYDFVFQAELKDALGNKFLKPELIRWELHRVWIVEGNLKQGKRHLYKTRRYYIDEDTWSAAAGETYDGQGNLWRVSFSYLVNLYDANANFDLPYSSHDLLQSIYSVNGKPNPGKFRLGSTKREKYFTSKALSRGGVR